jgi:putative transposon-encoded protein
MPEQTKEPQKKQFYRRTIKVGNSSGVLLPKSLLGAEVIVKIVSPPQNIKQDVLKLLAPFFEDILGIYIINIENKKVDILAVSSATSSSAQKGNYKIDIVPISLLKKSIKEKQQTKEKIKNAKTILNKRLLFELKKEASF